jgi:hypothetical protein
MMDLSALKTNRIPRLTIRWTIGDVSEYGFVALRLSVWGMWNLLGNTPSYVICANTIPLGQAQARTGSLPDVVSWRDVSAEFPTFLQSYFDEYKAEGVGWKFAPLRLSPGCRELAFDNDCIIWELPAAMRNWLQTPGSFLFAEDVQPCFGQFSVMCGRAARNSGIRGLPPGFDLGQAMLEVLNQNGITLCSELDEQGLQTAVLKRHDPFVVSTDEVSICSPFPPHMRNLGRCGAHFVGLNAKSLPWEYEGRPGVEYIREHWAAHLPMIRKKIPIPGG